MKIRPIEQKLWSTVQMWKGCIFVAVFEKGDVSFTIFHFKMVWKSIFLHGKGIKNIFETLRVATHFFLSDDNQGQVLIVATRDFKLSGPPRFTIVYSWQRIRKNEKNNNKWRELFERLMMIMITGKD